MRFTLVFALFILGCSSLNKPKPYGGAFELKKSTPKVAEKKPDSKLIIRPTAAASAIQKQNESEEINTLLSKPGIANSNSSIGILKAHAVKKTAPGKSQKQYSKGDKFASKKPVDKTNRGWIALLGGLLAVASIHAANTKMPKRNNLRLWIAKNPRKSKVIVGTATTLMLPASLYLGSNLADLNAGLAPALGAGLGAISLATFLAEKKFNSIGNLFSSNRKRIIPAIMLISMILGTTAIGSYKRVKNPEITISQMLLPDLKPKQSTAAEEAVKPNPEGSGTPARTTGMKVFLTVMVSIGLVVLAWIALAGACIIGCIVGSNNEALGILLGVFLAAVLLALIVWLGIKVIGDIWDS